MLGSISGINSYYRYAYSRPMSGLPTAQAAQVQGAQKAGAVWGARRAASPETPVEPVRPASPVEGNPADAVGRAIPIRLGADPVEMAVRMRIQYADPEQAAQGADPEQAAGVEGVQAAAEEGKCQTCEERKYQDGSDDMGVSFQTPTRVDPDVAASAVRGHEMEHVVREQAKAQREERKVVSQSVTLHTDICPECGKVYISGGTTRTTTMADKGPDPQQAAQQDNQARTPFSAVA